MKNHLKRIAAPKTWLIGRKINTFILRPKPGAHSLDQGLPLGVIMRDVLGLVSTLSEAKKVLNNKEILIDGKRRKDYRFIVGLLDTISIPEIKKYHRVVLDNKGRLIIIEIDAKEALQKLCQVKGKTSLSKGKIQYNLHDGTNLLTDTSAKVGDTFVLTLPSRKVDQVLSLSGGASVLLTKGKHSGDVGTLKELRGVEATYISQDHEIETLKKYLFVVGSKKPLLKITQ